MEKQEAIQQVDTLGTNLRLVDYEQLKVENRGYADKLEERDDELTKLRLKCDEIFQILAHLREKSASAALDIINEQNVLQAIEIEFMEVIYTLQETIYTILVCNTIYKQRFGYKIN